MRLSVKVNQQGIAIVWLVVIMVVVSTVGVAMLRLYSTSTAGWVDTNTTNEAKMLADSGARFFLSEYRAQTSDRKKNELIEELNEKTFNVATGGEGGFKLDVTSHFYRVTTSKKLSELKFVGTPGFSVPSRGFLKLDGDDTIYQYGGVKYNSDTGICAFTKENNASLIIKEASPVTEASSREAYTTVRPVVRANINAVSEGGPLTLGSLSSGSAEVFPSENGMVMIEKQEIRESLPVKTTVPYRYEYCNDNQLVNIQKGPSQRYFTNIEASSSAFVELGKLLTLESTGSFGDLASKTQTYRLSLDHARFTSGLKSYWNFDDSESFGKDAYGLGGGELKGAVQISRRQFMVGSALRFSGGHIETTFNPMVSIGLDRSFTIVFWAKPDTVGEEDNEIQTVIGAADSPFGFYIRKDKWDWSLGNKDGTMFKPPKYDHLPDATTNWQHVAYVYDGDNIILYINGLREYEQSIGRIDQLPNVNVGIGAPLTGTSASHFFYGLIDEVAVFNRALTFCEVNAIFNVPGNDVIKKISCNIGCYPDLASNPIVYYPFNGDANDQSGSNWDGKNPKAYHATVWRATPTEDRCGQDKKAYFFNGNSYLDTGINSKTVIENDNSFTVAFWVKPEKSNEHQTIVGSYYRKGKTELRFYIATHKGGWLWGYGDKTNETLSQHPVTANVWSHIGFVYNHDKKEIYIYLNGEEKSYSFSGTSVMPDLNVYIGARRRSDDQASSTSHDTYFEGAIDEVLIWKEALDIEKMKSLYKRTKP